MAIQANNIIDAKTIGERRRQKAAGLKQLARLDTPPDIQAVTSVLQTTLELEDLLGIFLEELAEYIPAEGISFRYSDQGVLIHQGIQARHSASYGLSLQNENLGELTIYRVQPFTEPELAILEHLLCALPYPMRNALRYRSALAGALVDPLTGVGNRSAMDRTLPRELELARRNKMPLTLLISDLDLFKQINDNHGHLAGDCVLRGSAKCLQGMLRGADQLFRYGGEEFVMLLPGSDREGALIVAERIRKGVAQASYDCEGKTISVTTSIGLAEMHDDDDANSLFDRADKALYRAKNSGRNRVAS